MATGAAAVPVEIEPGPVQGIVIAHRRFAMSQDRGLGEQVIPALTTLRDWAGVPDNTEHLFASIPKIDEVLLKGIGTESIGNFELLQRPLGVIGEYVKAFVFFVKTRRYVVIGEAAIVEVGFHCFVCCFGYRGKVMALSPMLILFSMAADAALAANILASGHL